jgi:hypothetical protein
MTMRNRWGPLLILAALALLSAPAPAQQFTFSVDVPTTLGGTPYQAYDAASYSAGVYSFAFSIFGAGAGAGANIDGLAILPDESVLFSVDAPATIAGIPFSASDIIRRSGSGPTTSYNLYRSAASMGLSAAADIDAIGVHPTTGNLLISFDAPETVGSVTFMPADIAEVGASLTMFFDASTSFVPDIMNTVGFECTVVSGHDRLYFNFDAPITLSTLVMPGDIAFKTTLPDNWQPNYFNDASWPPASAMTDFYFALPPPSPVPDGVQTGPGEDPVFAIKMNGGADMYVSYSRTCFMQSGGYNIIYGDLGTINYGNYDITGSVCNFDPDASSDQVITGVPSGDFWFIVVGQSGTAEGSWGWEYIGGSYNERGGAGWSAQCGVLRKDISGTCP